MTTFPAIYPTNSIPVETPLTVAFPTSTATSATPFPTSTATFPTALAPVATPSPTVFAVSTTVSTTTLASYLKKDMKKNVYNYECLVLKVIF